MGCGAESLDNGNGGAAGSGGNTIADETSAVHDPNFGLGDDEASLIVAPSNALACTANSQCASGYCVDGFCCDAKCDNKCMACSQAKKGSGADGICGSIAYDTDPDNDCPYGACDGKNQCKNYNGFACTATSQCLSNYCVDGFCCNITCMGSCQACSAAKKGSGADGTCGNIPNGTDPDNECNPGECNGSGACNSLPQPTSANGAKCNSATQCASGNCVDGVCCDTTCNSTCMACTALLKGSGSDGTCGPIPNDKDPDDECWGGACNGSGVCKQYNGVPCLDKSQCLSNYCVDGVCCNLTCNGMCQACSEGKKGQGYDGVCGPIVAGRDLDNECNPGECNGSGACNQPQTPQANGTVCVSAGQCASGNCVDGVCCDTACTDTCKACTAAKKGSGADGTCGLIGSELDPDKECNGGKCDGKGFCRYYNGAPCTGTGQCFSNYCVDGVCCNLSCSGLCQACSIAKKGSGYDGVCGNVKTSTDPDNECNPGECNGSGACNQPQSPQSNGAACTLATQCISGNCVDGVCCDTACFETCKACSAAKKGSGTSGTCGPIKYDTDPDNECDAGACSGSGTCQYYNGVACTGTSGCLSHYCVDGFCCNITCGGTCQACSAAKKGSGYDGTCGNIANNTNPDNECALSCNGSGACTKAPDGSTCASAADCTSGFCTDGVCCSSACTGTCQACSAAKKGSGSDGTCGPIVANSDPDDECPLGMCDGTGVCTVLAANGTACTADAQCGSNHCADGVCCTTACTGTCVACNLSGKVGTCSNIDAGQSDPTGTPACNDMCDGAGQCVKATGAACTSGKECASHICNNEVCDSAKPANGPMAWMTMPTGHSDPTEIAAYNDGQGLAVVGYWASDFLKGSISPDGVPALSHYGPIGGSPYMQYDYLHLARGGVFAYYEMVDRTCSFGTCSYSCNILGPAGLSGPLTYIIGKNDAGQVGGLYRGGSGSCAPTGYGSINATDHLQRASSSGTKEVDIVVPAGITTPIVLGAAGEFHWGTGISLTKTDVNGAMSWTKTGTGSISSAAWDVDAAGNIVIAASFSGSIDYGGGAMTATGPRDLGLIKLSPSGSVVWQKHFGSVTFTMGTVRALSRTGTGDMTVFGSYTGTLALGTGTLARSNFIAKFDSAGNPLWDVDIVASDVLWVVGDLAGDVYIGAPQWRPDGNTNAVDLGWGVINAFFVAKYH